MCKNISEIFSQSHGTFQKENAMYVYGNLLWNSWKSSVYFQGFISSIHVINLSKQKNLWTDMANNNLEIIHDPEEGLKT